MWCAVIFGLFFFIYGIYMIVTKKGMRVFSKAHEDVTGGEAIAQGVIAILVGVFFLWLGFGN
jgi:UPF0716 family protein affecting phage T7 exclusion